MELKEKKAPPPKSIKFVLWGGRGWELPCTSTQQKSLSGMDSPQDRAECMQSKCGEQYSLLTNQQIKPKL